MDMLQAWVNVSVFVLVLALLAWGLKHWRRGAGAPSPALASPIKLLNVLPLGGQERIVTVEVGPAHARCQLVLGVTAQSIQTLLHFPTGVVLPQTCGESQACTQPGSAGVQEPVHV